MGTRSLIPSPSPKPCRWQLKSAKVPWTLALDRELLFLACVLSINVNSFARWDLQTLPSGPSLPLAQSFKYDNTEIVQKGASLLDFQRVFTKRRVYLGIVHFGMNDLLLDSPHSGPIFGHLVPRGYLAGLTQPHLRQCFGQNRSSHRTTKGRTSVDLSINASLRRLLKCSTTPSPFANFLSTSSCDCQC